MDANHWQQLPFNQQLAHLDECSLIILSIEKKDAAEKIAAAGFDLGKGKRFKYGKGVYSTPSPAEAERYAVDFRWEGKSFKVMLQNRVNMDDTKVVPDGNRSGSEYFVTAEEDNIRPYGILVKEM